MKNGGGRKNTPSLPTKAGVAAAKTAKIRHMLSTGTYFYNQLEKKIL